MNRTFHAVFDQEDNILSATAACRDRGFEIIDAHTPYPVHGLDRAMGLEPSRITFVCFALGLLGASAMLWLQVWTSSVDWPINIGGKPLNSVAAFFPVTFESAVLFAGLGTIFVMLARSGLHPFRRSTFSDPRLTDDHFLLAIRQTDADLDPGLAQELFLEHGAIEVRDLAQEERR